MLDLLHIIKSLPMQNHEKIGAAVGYDFICNALRVRGVENIQLINSQLEQLGNKGLLEVFHMDDFDDNLIIAVRVK